MFIKYHLILWMSADIGPTSKVNEHLPIGGMIAVAEDSVKSVQTKLPTRR